MRFEQYILNEQNVSISWDAVIRNIQNNCKHYLKLLKPTGGVFYRGYKSNELYIKKKTRTDRKPLSTSQKTHELLDDAFKEKFGWKARSEGVFTSGRPDGAYLYGRVYLFFPKGLSTYIYAPDINDLFVQLHSLISLHGGSEATMAFMRNDVSKMDDVIKTIVNKYYVQNGNINEALKCREVVWKCKEFYMLHFDSVNEKFGSVKNFMRMLTK